MLIKPYLSRYWIPILSTLMVLMALILPFLYGDYSGGSEFVFWGFLLNPIDGNSYMAKMVQGQQGNWMFRLPYTAGAEPKAYIHLFYLFLGHLARLLKLEVLVVFHLARLAGVLTLLLGIFRFYRNMLPPTLHNNAFILAAMGSGLGWLVMPFGFYTSDFWVAEIYPFLSSLVNPHFPFGIAIILMLLSTTRKKQVESESAITKSSLLPLVWSLLAAFSLGIILPFGVVIVTVVLTGSLVWEWVELYKNKDLTLYKCMLNPISQTLVATLLGGAPVLLYYLWMIYSDPVLTGWNAQNLTPSPPLWDTFLALLPALLLALIGCWAVIRERNTTARTMIIWVGAGLLLAYLPFNLQRRMLTGIYIPLCGLAALGLNYLASKRPLLWKAGWITTFILVIPTNLIVLLLGLHGINTHDPMFYLSRPEKDALQWIEAHTNPDAVILASPDTSLFIPAHTGRQVIYGHPFETVNATQKKAEVMSFFQIAGTTGSESLFAEVDYIYIGPREESISKERILLELPMVYKNQAVTIYTINP